MAPVHIQISDRNPLSDYTRAVSLLLQLQGKGEANLNSIISVLQKFSPLPDGQVLRPRAPDFPQRDVLERDVRTAIELMDAKTTDWKTAARTFPVIITLYELYSTRVDAISAYNMRAPPIPGAHYPPAPIAGNVPDEDVYRASDRLRLLRPIDDIIGFYYGALRNGTLQDPLLTYVVNFVYQIVSHYGPERELSLQTTSDFFLGLRREASGSIYAFVLLSTGYDFPPDVISPADVLGWAESSVAGLVGSVQQGHFVEQLFSGQKFNRQTYAALNPLTRHALRCPYDIWPALTGCCIACGRTAARFSCTRCRRILYCGRDCQLA
ncbi:unnamed protein product [Peniophora sp. CBMAI 1063]|nr:unnamed protein product [Peniophora sp. CBMAI 1063]